MVWLVLEWVVIPGIFGLHSKAKWDSMSANDRYWSKVVKECATRDEANTVLDECREKARQACQGIDRRRGLT
jgi:hypothetical protein